MNDRDSDQVKMKLEQVSTITQENAVRDSMHPRDFREAVEWWDEGKILWTVDMGGMGPGYEQAIQCYMLEILRSLGDERPSVFSVFKEMAEAVLKKHNEQLGGLSGAQFGVALNLAWNFSNPTRSWKEVLDSADKDRHIMITKNWPHAETEPKQ